MRIKSVGLYLYLLLTAIISSVAFCANANYPCADTHVDGGFEINDDFDSYPDHWSLWGQTWDGLIYHQDDPAGAHSGDDYFEMGLSWGSWAGIHDNKGDETEVVSGTDVTMSAYMRWADGEIFAVGTFKIEFYATRSEDWSDGSTPFVERTFPLTAEWAYYETEPITVPFGMNFARATIVAGFFPFYIDDVQISQGFVGFVKDPVPVTGTKNLPTDVVLEWDAPCSIENPSYYLHLHTDGPDFHTTVTDPFIDLSVSGFLKEGADYGWYVRTTDLDTGQGYSSEYWYFSTLASPVTCPDGDFSGDCKTNMTDLLLLASEWIGTYDLGELSDVGRGWQDEVGPIVISEFMADNNNTIEDEDGDSSDWIELYNPTSSQVDLKDWCLTDGSLIPWCFPESIMIDSKGYLLVYASGKNRGGPYFCHTDFKLNDKGEYLVLSDPFGNIIQSYDPNYPGQPEDTSYGLLANVDSHFVDPSPGVPNNAGYSAIAKKPKILVDGGLITSGVDVSITVESATATIRYTTDGTEPDEFSTIYTEPVEIDMSSSVMIRARAFEADSSIAPSSVVSEGYLPLDASFQSFSSNLPIVVIDSFGDDIDADNDIWSVLPLKQVYSVFIDADDATGVASITGEADYIGRAGMKVRGQSSAGWDKKQYGFETWDSKGNDKNVSLLGLPKESDWILYAPYVDKTLMRNVLAYKWSNAIGRYASRTKYVEMFYNRDGNIVTMDDYHGVYILMEKIKRDDDRVDVNELTPYIDTEPGITGGYIFKHDNNRRSPKDEEFRTSYDLTGNFIYVEPEGTDISQVQKDWLTGYLDAFESDLIDGYSSGFDPAYDYEKHIDVDSFIDHHLLVEMMKNIDGFRLSTFMHIDRGGKLTMGPVWDFNLGSGNATYPDWGYPDSFSKANAWYYPDIGENPERHSWYNILMTDPEYMMRYADRWFEFREDLFSDERLLSDMDDVLTLLDSDGPLVNTGSTPADRNFNKWQGKYNQVTGEWDDDYGVWDSILNGKMLGNYYHGAPLLPHTYKMEVEWLKQWLTGKGTPALGEIYESDYSDRLGWMDENMAGVAPPDVIVNDVVRNSDAQINDGDVLSFDGPTGSDIYYTLDGGDPRTPGGGTAAGALLYTSDYFPGCIGSVVYEEDFESDPGWSLDLPSGVSGWEWGEPLGLGGSHGNSDPSAGYGGSSNVLGYNLSGDYDNDITSTQWAMSPAINCACISGAELNFYRWLNVENLPFDRVSVEVSNDGSSWTEIWVNTTTMLTDSSWSQQTFDISSVADGQEEVYVRFGIGPTDGSWKFSGWNIDDVTVSGTALGVAPAPIVLNGTSHVMVRSMDDGGNWSALNRSTLTVGQELFINEFMADNKSFEDPENPGTTPDWIEMYNSSASDIDLGGMYLTDHPSDPNDWHQIDEGVSVPAEGYMFFWADNDTEEGDLHLGFRLSKSGESVTLIAADGVTVLDSISFSIQEPDESYGRSPDGSDDWQVFTNPTPGGTNTPIEQIDLIGPGDPPSALCLFSCRGNLANIIPDTFFILENAEDSYPSTLEALITLGVLQAEDLLCPCTDDTAGENSYIYRGDGILFSHSASLIIAHDKESNHSQSIGGRNVLFKDGSVETMSELEFLMAIHADNVLRSQYGLGSMDAGIVVTNTSAERPRERAVR